MDPIAIFASLAAVVVIVLLVVRPPLGIAALLAFYPLMTEVPRSPVPGLNAETIILGLAMIVTLGRSGLRVPPLRVSGPVLALLVVAVIGFVIARTIVDSYDPLLAAWDRFKALKARSFATLLFFIAYWWIRTPEHRQRALEGVSVGLMVLAITMLGEVGGEERAAGLYRNANIPGDILGVFTLCPLYLVWFGDLSRLRRLLHVLIYLVAVVVLLYTLSRGAWLACAVGHMVFFLLADRRVLVLGVVSAVLMLGVGLPLAPEPVRDRIERTFETGDKVYQVAGGLSIEGSAASRIVVYRMGFDMFLDSPLWGQGSGGFLARAPHFGAKYGMVKRISPHSYPNEVASESGMIGLMALFWLSSTVLMLGYALLRSRELSPLGVLMITIGLATGTVNLFHTDFPINPVSARYFWAIYGLCAAAYFSAPRARV